MDLLAIGKQPGKFMKKRYILFAAASVAMLSITSA
jgi:hypothetical protein